MQRTLNMTLGGLFSKITATHSIKRKVGGLIPLKYDGLLSEYFVDSNSRKLIPMEILR